MRIRVIYFIEEALSSFRHNWVMSFAAIMVVLVSVLIVGFFMVLGHIGSKVTSDLEKKVEIEVFLKDAAPKEEIYSIERKIKTFNQIKEVEYISKEKALEIFIRRNKNNKGLIDQIPGNPLPASYRVILKDPHDVEKIAKKIKHFPEKSASIENIQYGKDIVNKIFAVTGVLRYIALGLGIFLVLAALALISNTIRLAIYARRREIAIMRLVGASNWFIRWPFFLEGIIEGLIGALLAIGILSSVRYALLSKLELQLQFMSALQISPVFWRNLLLILLGSGVVIGALGSVIALRRYLKI